MTKHTYAVTYNVKKNGSVWGRKVYIDADTTKEAKDKFKIMTCGQCYYEPQHHAFNVHVYVADKEPALAANYTNNKYAHILEV